MRRIFERRALEKLTCELVVLLVEVERPNLQATALISSVMFKPPQPMSAAVIEQAKRHHG